MAMDFATAYKADKENNGVAAFNRVVLQLSADSLSADDLTILRRLGVSISDFTPEGGEWNVSNEGHYALTIPGGVFDQHAEQVEAQQVRIEDLRSDTLGKVELIAAVYLIAAEGAHRTSVERSMGVSGVESNAGLSTRQELGNFATELVRSILGDRLLRIPTGTYIPARPRLKKGPQLNCIVSLLGEPEVVEAKLALLRARGIVVQNVRGVKNEFHLAIPLEAFVLLDKDAQPAEVRVATELGQVSGSVREIVSRA